MRAIARRLRAALPLTWRYRWRLFKLRRSLHASARDSVPAAAPVSDEASPGPDPNSPGASGSAAADSPAVPDLETLSYSPTESATVADVHACYRLFLGRAPDPEGLAAYQDAVLRGGLDLAGLVQSFTRSAEYRERQASQAENREYTVAELELFRMYLMPDDWSVSKSILATGTMEPHVTAALQRVLRPGMSFVDVGANIGYFTMLGARLVGPGGRVTAFEASPQNCSLIYASAALNGFENIRIEALAVAEAGGPYLYQSSGSNGRIVPFDLAAGSPDALRGDFLWAGTLAERLAGEPAVDVIKIDIEGAEYRALLGAGDILRKRRPVILTEFSPPQLAGVSGLDDRGRGYLELIHEAGYEFAILAGDGAVVECGGSIDRVLGYYEDAAQGLLDLMCTPT
ncbi:MAG: FkbM family methyltransferase [bacterium]|nr:FkbM family methyltransferase [bacterium]